MKSKTTVLIPQNTRKEPASSGEWIVTKEGRTIRVGEITDLEPEREAGGLVYTAPSDRELWAQEKERLEIEARREAFRRKLNREANAYAFKKAAPVIVVGGGIVTAGLVFSFAYVFLCAVVLFFLGLFLSSLSFGASVTKTGTGTKKNGQGVGDVTTNVFVNGHAGSVTTNVFVNSQNS